MNVQEIPTDKQLHKQAMLCWDAGGIIRERRLILGLTEIQCADALGISAETFHAMEWGDISVEPGDYVRVCNELSQLNAS